MRASGELTKDEFERKKRSLSEEKERMNNLLKDTDNRVDDWLEKADKFFDFAENAKKSFENGSIEVKKVFYQR